MLWGTVILLCGMMLQNIDAGMFCSQMYFDLFFVIF